MPRMPFSHRSSSFSTVSGSAFLVFKPNSWDFKRSILNPVQNDIQQTPCCGKSQLVDFHSVEQTGIFHRKRDAMSLEDKGHCSAFMLLKWTKKTTEKALAKVELSLSSFTEKLLDVLLLGLLSHHWFQMLMHQFVPLCVFIGITASVALATSSRVAGAANCYCFWSGSCFSVVVTWGGVSSTKNVPLWGWKEAVCQSYSCAQMQSHHSTWEDP